MKLSVAGSVVDALFSRGPKGSNRPRVSGDDFTKHLGKDKVEFARGNSEGHRQDQVAKSRKDTVSIEPVPVDAAPTDKVSTEPVDATPVDAAKSPPVDDDIQSLATR